CVKHNSSNWELKWPFVEILSGLVSDNGICCWFFRAQSIGHSRSEDADCGYDGLHTSSFFGD
ncbi:MAG TPA: hypothetical protein PKJ85_13595, partial [Nitrosomonas nitrosa]|nr:hypothetical protein [Nitrosomonas nitrosa]